MIKNLKGIMREIELMNTEYIPKQGEYTPVLKLKENYNLIGPERSTNHIIDNDGITQSLISLTPVKISQISCIFYNLKETFDSAINYKSLICNAKILKELLREEGTLAIQVSNNYSNTVRNCMDNVFGRDGLIAEIKVNSNPGGSISKGIRDNYHTLLLYSKNIEKSLSIYGYDVGNRKCFCIPTDKYTEEKVNINIKYKYEDDRSKYTLNTYRRSNQRNIGRDNSYYPIYYLPKVNGDKIDLNPNLFIDDPGIEGIIEIYPKSDNGIEYKWNGIKKKTEKLIQEGNLCVNNVGHRYLVEYKSRPNSNEYGEIMEPLSTVFDTDVSNLGLTINLQKITGYKSNYYGISEKVVSNILASFTKEDDDIMFIGDEYLSGILAIEELDLYYNTYTVNCIESFTKRSLDSLSNIYGTQMLTYSVESLFSEDDDISFLDEFDLGETYSILKYNSILSYCNEQQYSIKETSDGNILIIIKEYYNPVLYDRISMHLGELGILGTGQELRIIFKGDSYDFLGKQYYVNYNIKTENISMDILKIQHKLYRNLMSRR